MIKATFLTQLQQNIAMLDDDEQKDILDEYTQHIDMKVAGGMTEAEAIEDFGPFDDLIAEILSAYHVKVPAASTPAQTPANAPTAAAVTAAAVAGAAAAAADSAKPASALAELAESAGATGKAAGRAVGSAASKAAAATRNGARKAADAISGGMGKVAAKVRAASETPDTLDPDDAAGCTAAPAHSAPSADAPTNGAHTTASVGSGLIRRMGRTVKHALSWCWKTIRTLIRWAWNAFAAFAAGMLLLFGLFCLAATGFSVMLLLQGFPMMGATLALLGASIALLSASYLVTRLIVRKQPDAGTLSDAQAQTRPPADAAPTARLDAAEYADPDSTQPLFQNRTLPAREPQYRDFEGLAVPFSRKMGAIHE